jgi:hypothetical protein
MKTLYEVLNVDLAQQYTKARKLAVLDELDLENELDALAREAVAAMDIPEDDDRYHWIQIFGRLMGADLITIGKVQPEHMLGASALPAEDFTEAVKVCTATARDINNSTVEAEKEFAQESIPQTL